MSPIHRVVPLSAIAIAGVLLAAEARLDIIKIDVEAALVTITPRLPGRNLIRIPTLEIAFTVAATCRDEWNARSLSLSVADTRRSYSATELDENTPESIALRVPGEQIAPLAVDEFCVVAEADAQTHAATDDEQLLVRDAFSAHASLLCASNQEQRMNYVSRTLDVILVCDRSNEGPAVEVAER
jgi:hypothetical protein